MSKYAGQLQAKLDAYQKAGYKEGGKGLPPTTATSFDLHEAKLHAEAKKYALEAHSAFKRLETEKSKAIADIDNGLTQLEADSDVLLNDKDLKLVVEHAMAQETRQLVDYKKEQLEREAALKSFCAVNGITTPADYPPSRHWSFAWLITFILIETIMNAFFYQNANGLLGGAIVALGVAVVNLGAAWALGHWFTYKNLKDTGWRAFGWSCLGVAMVLSIFLNAVFATFRAEYEAIQDPNDPAQTGVAFGNAIEAATQVFFFHFPASSFMSFILFFIGLIFTGIAFYKGYSFDDKYPGHGNLDRLYRQAKNNFDGLSLLVKERIRAEIERKRNQYAEAKSQLQQSSAQVTQIKGGISNAFADMRTSLKQIQGEFALVLKSYREANIAVRPVPAPDYFSETPSVISAYEDEEGDTLLSQLSTLEERVNDMKERFMAELTEKLNALTEEGKELQGKFFNEFLEDISREAKQQINAGKPVMPNTSGAAYEV